MTLVEMSIVIFVVSAVFFLLIGWMGNMQARAKHDLARRMLSDLDKALSRYHRATGRFPASYEPSSSKTVIIDFLDHERTRKIMEGLPDSLWAGPGRRNLTDPWGTPVKYFDAESGSIYVKANSGRPVFISAGPDRDFGEGDPSRLGDNLRSDDPGPDGFRLHESFRDSMDQQERDSGKEGN